jgi:hypothetical protein
MRGMVSGGLVLEDLTDLEREARGLGISDLALSVKFVGQYGKHAAAKKAGFMKDDVIVSIAGLSRRLTEGELIGQLMRNHPMGESLETTVLRGTKKVELTLPMQ